MGNLAFSTRFFRTDATAPAQIREGRFLSKKISSGITYYYAPFPAVRDQTGCAAKESQTSTADLSSSLLLSDSPPHAPASSLNQSNSASTSRTLLLFFSWLGAHPGAVTKYRDLYLDRGMDVLLVQSGVMHFLWPRWGLDYGLQVLNILEDPQFSGRPVLVHASSIGGYTFSQILQHIAQDEKRHAALTQHVVGNIFDSLVYGSLEHMAIGLGKTLLPRFEGFIKNTAMIYFWLFKSHTTDFYNKSIQAFYHSPITVPTLFFFSEDDVLCNADALEKLIDLWRKRGPAVQSRKWKESKHAAHMRCHPEDYISSLEKFLNSLPISSVKTKNE